MTGVKGPSAPADQPTCGALQAAGGSKGFCAALPWSGGGCARKEQRMGLESDQDGLLADIGEQVSAPQAGSLSFLIWTMGSCSRDHATQVPLHPCEPFLVWLPTHVGVCSPAMPCAWVTFSKNRSRPLEPRCPHAHMPSELAVPGH